MTPVQLQNMLKTFQAVNKDQREEEIHKLKLIQNEEIHRAKQIQDDELHRFNLAREGIKTVQLAAKDPNPPKNPKDSDKEGSASPKVSKKPIKVVIGPLGIRSEDRFDSSNLIKGVEDTHGSPPPGSTDKIPAWLTPGEAVIPAPAAQDPNNRPLIEEMIQDGREINHAPGYADGEANVDSIDSVIARMKAADPSLNTDYVRSAWERADPAARAALVKKINDIQIPATRVTPVSTQAPLSAPSDRPSDAQIIAATSNIDRMAAADTPVPVSQYNTNSKTERKMADNVNSRLIVEGQKAPLSEADKKELIAEIARTKDPAARKILEAHLAERLMLERNGGDSLPPVPKEILAEIPPPRVHRRGGTSGMMRDLAQGQLNPTYDAELANRAATGTPEEQAIAKAEIERLARARGTPVLQTRNAIPPVPPPPPSSPVSIPPPKKEPTYTPNDQLPGESRKLGLTPPTPTDGINARLNNPESTEAKAMYNLQKDVASGKVPPDQGTLANILSSIWGPSGLFREEDLGRFALVAAGGLLFGGSTRGSLQYAARDSLAFGDKRRALESAQRNREIEKLEGRTYTEKQQAQRDVQTRITQKETAINTGLSAVKVSDPKVAAGIDVILQKAREEHAKGNYEESERLMQQALTETGRAQENIALKERMRVAAEKAGLPPEVHATTTHTSRREPGKVWEIGKDKYGKPYVFDPASSSMVPVTKENVPGYGTDVVPSTFQRGQAEDIHKAMVTPILKVINNKYKDDKTMTPAMRETKAEDIANQLVLISGNFRGDPVAMAAIADGVSRRLDKAGIEDPSSELAQSIYFGEIAANSMPEQALKYNRSAPTGPNGRTTDLSIKAAQAIGSSVKEAVQNGNVSAGDAYKNLTTLFEKEWGKVKEEDKQKLLLKLRLPTGQWVGYNPFAYWVENKSFK